MWPNLMSFSFVVSTIDTENRTQILSQFRADLKEDLQTELLARGVTEREKAYVLVQDLYYIRTNHTFKSHDYRASISKPFLSLKPNMSSTQNPLQRNYWPKVHLP